MGVARETWAMRGGRETPTAKTNQRPGGCPPKLQAHFPGMQRARNLRTAPRSLQQLGRPRLCPLACRGDGYEPGTSLLVFDPISTFRISITGTSKAFEFRRSEKRGASRAPRAARRRGFAGGATTRPSLAHGGRLRRPPCAHLPEVVAAPAPARQPCSTLLHARHPSASLREGRRESRDLQQLGRPRLALFLARGRA